MGFLEAQKREEEEYKIKHPENYVVYRMDTRKSAMKNDDSVVIRHVCESIVSIKDFAGEKQLFGRLDFWFFLLFYLQWPHSSETLKIPSGSSLSIFISIYS